MSDAAEPNIDDVFSAITDIEPGVIPLLVRMPDGNCSQIDVPVSSTVEDIRTNIRQNTGTEDIKLSFGNEDLPPGALLQDTNIIDAYQHASSLIQTIANNGLDPDKKAAALDSACAVVESISNGIKDMEALCAAAVSTGHMPDLPVSQSAIAKIMAEGAAEEERDTPKVLDSEFKLLDSVLSKDYTAPTTPAALVRGLSRRLPSLFPSTAPDAPPEQPSLTTQRSNLIIQPSISNIREARRRARETRSTESSEKADAHAPDPFNIGNSTHEMIDPPPDPDPAASAAARASSGAILANSGKSTWLEDVMKTWEVGVVRESGVLEKTEDGKELNNYLEGLEAEVQRDIDIAQLSANDSGGAGDSEDEDEEDAQDKANGPEQEDATSDVRRTMANIVLVDKSSNDPSNRSNTNPHGSIQADAAQQMLSAQSAATAALESVKQPNETSTDASPSDTSVSGQSSRSNSTYVGSTKPAVRARQATPIAPAPNMTSPNGAPMCYPPVAAWKPPVPGQKRRGRKRKNPELSEEDRALLRKEQNRESAKLSRVRRKVIAAEYEGRLNSLLNENTQLKKQVEGLNNRLVYLQSLLTVSVRPDTS